jgi:hypothetical protein
LTAEEINLLHGQTETVAALGKISKYLKSELAGKTGSSEPTKHIAIHPFYGTPPAP